MLKKKNNYQNNIHQKMIRGGAKNLRLYWIPWSILDGPERGLLAAKGGVFEQVPILDLSHESWPYISNKII